MINNKTILGIILARGGSKRLPMKNILSLGGIPLIQWTINAGINSKYLDDLIVSSDSREILKIAKKSGVKAQLRPKDLSDDYSTSYESTEYVINNLNHEYDYVMLLQPTSPLRNERHIDESIEQMILKNANAVISVCKSEYKKTIINVLPENNDMSNFIVSDDKNGQSEYYRINGAIYLCKLNFFLKEKTFFISEKIFAYKMETSNSLDIDTKLDFEIAKFLIEKNESSNYF
tara:strand:+ start:2765 stop:3460 length:696 start_codon:yes stop_codon:yes gene_type:complete